MLTNMAEIIPVKASVQLVSGTCKHTGLQMAALVLSGAFI